MTQELLTTAIEAVRAAADAIQAKIDAPQDITIEEKGYLDVVTEADFAADAAIQRVIKHRHPGHFILSEESEEAKAMQNMAAWQPPSGMWWAIDPLDGTNNFSRGIPSWCITMAAAQGENVLAGVVYDVNRGHLITVVRGSGVELNGRPVRVNDRDDFRWALCSTDWPVDSALRQNTLRWVNRIMPHARSLRSWGTTALSLAYIAVGWGDVHIGLQFKPWDVAAGILMIQEAGGMITEPDGSPWRWQSAGILASNGHLHSDVVNFTRD